MPLPTTREGRYDHRRRKYLRKGYRRRWSYPYDYQDGPVIDRNHPRGPYEFIGNGKQITLRKSLKSATHGFPIVTPFPPDVRVSDHDKTHPPHVSLGPFGHPPYRVKDYSPVCNYHRRAVNYRGRKTPRMNGDDRQRYFATLSAKYYFELTGTHFYPPWDPLGRSPVDPVLFWDR